MQSDKNESDTVSSKVKTRKCSLKWIDASKTVWIGSLFRIFTMRLQIVIFIRSSRFTRQAYACVQHREEINLILMQLTIGDRASQSRPHVPFSHLTSTIDVGPTRCRRRLLVSNAAQTRSWPGRVELSRAEQRRFCLRWLSLLYDGQQRDGDPDTIIVHAAAAAAATGRGKRWTSPSSGGATDPPDTYW